MTASSTRRSRLESSSDTISSKVGTTSEKCQVSSKAIEAEPSRHGQHKPTAALQVRPARFDPCAGSLDFGNRKLQAGHRSQSQVHGFGHSVFARKALAPCDR